MNIYSPFNFCYPLIKYFAMRFRPDFQLPMGPMAPPQQFLVEIHGRRLRLGAPENGQHGAGRIHVVEGKLQGLGTWQGGGKDVF